ncbi:hypothetical protein AGMMS50229_00690 [Campylobacterota bacterium]|nr:hypothetical protein AGMMS50229_00690 [Campylobacterota bacterium]
MSQIPYGIITRNSQTGFVTTIAGSNHSKSYIYDTMGLPTAITTSGYTETITRNADTKINTIKENINNKGVQTYSYEYDQLGRLIKTSKNSVVVEQYQYDDQGNRIASTINGIATTTTYVFSTGALLGILQD